MAVDIEVKSKRVADMLAKCVDVKLGTLWWVREDLWQEAVDDYDKNSTRDSHPALSIRKTPPASLFEMVPMLHGTSDSTAQRCVQVKGVSSDRGPNHITYFRSISPGGTSISMKEFQPSESKRRKELEGYWHDHVRMTPNFHKRTITADEMKMLEQYLIKQGLL